MPRIKMFIHSFIRVSTEDYLPIQCMDCTHTGLILEKTRNEPKLNPPKVAMEYLMEILHMSIVFIYVCDSSQHCVSVMTMPCFNERLYKGVRTRRLCA